VSGDRWALAYNKNLLVDGRNFYQSGYYLNDALTAFSSGSFSFLSTDYSWTARTNGTIITPIY